MDTAAVRAEVARRSDVEQITRNTILRLCDDLDAALLEAANMRVERDHAHREVAERTVERDEARLTIRRMDGAE
jgi:hypothetical protein